MAQLLGIVIKNIYDFVDIVNEIKIIQYGRRLLMLKVLETDLCKFNYSESLEPLVKATAILLEQKIVEYNTFFNINNTEKIVINYFDKIEDFREFIYSLRGEKNSLPEYAKGTYDNEMVNAYINPEY